MLSGLSLNLIDGENGTITPEQVEPLIRPTSAYYMPQTKVIEVENTHNVAGGVVHPIENIKTLKTLADKYGLKMHLDGARLWNASAATGISVSEYSSYFDSVSVCLSKGLGAPVGSVILGEKELIEEAFRKRKSWGGGMRQIGILAAAGQFAIENNFEKLAEDHKKAKILAEHVAKLQNVEIDLDLVQTNIIMFKSKSMMVEDVLQKCKAKGLLLSIGSVGIIRAVTHLDISFEDIDSTKQILSEVFDA